jgi:hypothetical protein
MKNTDEIIEAVKNEVGYYETAVIKSNPPFARTQGELYDLIDLYMLSQYRDSNTDSFSQPKTFYNISSFPVDVAAKITDIDTKDILLMAEDENYWATWLMEKELKYWFKDTYFGKELNRYSYLLPRDGHLVLKKVDDQVQIVPIKNLRFRPDAVSLKNIPLTEVFKYQPDEFEVEAEKRGWENVKETINDRKKIISYNTEDKIQVYGSYFPKGFLKSKYNYFLISDNGQILSYITMAKSPYKDLAWEEVQGRAVGRGQVEKLMPEQIYLNRMANAKAEGLYWTSKLLFQSRDPSVGINLMVQSENGDVLTPTSEIEQINIQDRNLGFYNYDEARWERQATRNSFSTESVTGQRAPSGTPLGETVLNAQMTSGYYQPKKENLSELIKEVLWDWVLPEFKKQNRSEHKVLFKNILEDDINSENFFKMMLDSRMNKLRANEKYLTPEQWKIRRSVNAELLKNEKLSVPKGTYDDLKYKMSIVISGEEIDIQSKQAVGQVVIQTLNANPNILRDPLLRRAFFKTLNWMGINPLEFGLSEPLQTMGEVLGEVRAQQGGSTAAPQSPTQPTMVNTQQTI